MITKRLQPIYKTALMIADGFEESEYCDDIEGAFCLREAKDAFKIDVAQCYLDNLEANEAADMFAEMYSNEFIHPCVAFKENGLAIIQQKITDYVVECINDRFSQNLDDIRNYRRECKHAV